MPAINRTLIKSGPAILKWNGATLYFRDGLTIEEERTFTEIKTDFFTGSEKRADDRMVTFKGTPAGAWKDLAILFALLSAPMGTRLFGASDKTAVAHFLDGDVFTYHNAGLAELPAIICSPTKTMLGGISFEARTKNNTDPSAASSLVTRSSAAFGDTSFDLAEIPTLAYALAFGADPWDDFQTVDGVEIRPRVSWRDIACDNLGVVEKELVGLEVSAAFAPLAIAQSAIDAKLGLQNSPAAVRGARVADELGEDFTLTGSGVYIALHNAILRNAPMRAQAGTARHQRLEAVTSLDITAGAAVAQLVVDTAPPAP